MLERTELVKALNELGIDAENYRTLSLLPFVLVAWADGKVQSAERDRIVELARAKGLLGPGGESLLTSWLEEQPSPEYYSSGFKVLIELARKKRGLGADISTGSLQELIELSFDVASVAGGLFGKVWSVSATEQDALDELARILTIDDGQSWSEMLEDLD